jgi:hypothetical protein
VNVIQGGTLFQLLRNKLGKKTLSIRKTKDGTPLFVSAHQKEYKLVIHPILISRNEPAFLEKTALFSYQRRINLHVIEFEAIKALVTFLEKKVSVKESFLNGNAVIGYDNSLKKMKTDFRTYSIPFLLFGFLLLFVMFLQNSFLLAMFTNLGIAALIIYGFILWFVYNTFIKSQKAFKKDYQTPYYLKPVQIDEIGFYSIKDSMSAHELDQLIYEWFGKSYEFSFISEIEKEIILEDQEDIETPDIPLKNEGIAIIDSQYSREKRNIGANSPHDAKNETLKEKMISKYITFLED